MGYEHEGEWEMKKKILIIAGIIVVIAIAVILRTMAHSHFQVILKLLRPTLASNYQGGL
jgi:hypothetical protein